MRKLLLPLVLCAPVAANADLLLLKYEGTVSSIENEGAAPNTYSIGDPVSGHLIIDAGIAHLYPTVGIPTSGGSGRSQANYAPFPFGSADFITGRPSMPGGNIIDRITVTNNAPLEVTGSAGTEDRFSLIEGFESNGPPEGPLLIPPGRQDLFSIGVSRRSKPDGQLFNDTALEQTFDLTPSEGTSLSGGLMHSLGAAAGSFRQTIGLTFSHVSLGVCHKT